MSHRLPAAVAAAAAVGALLATLGCADIVTDILEYGSVEVETARRNGDPVPGVELLLYTGPHARGMGTTDASGRHRFEFVPPNVYGVRATPPEGYARPEELLGGPTSAYVDTLSLEEGGSRSVRFTYLKKGPGKITATVRDAGGAAVPDALVSLFSPLATVQESPAGSSGTVVFEDVPYGVWGVRVAPPALYLGEGETVFEQDGILVEEGSAETAAFALEPCLGTLGVRVGTAAGAAVAGYPVRLYQVGGTLEEGPTASDGVKTFGPLMCRTFGVALVPKQDWEFTEGPGTSWLDGLRVTRGSDTTVAFTVASCHGRIRGSVRDQAGAPLSGAGFTLFGPDGDLAADTTDAAGSHAFAVRGCQDFGVRLTPPGGYTAGTGRGVGFFDGIRLRDGAVRDVAFVATWCAGEVRVSVVDQAGSPVQGAVLTLFSSAGSLLEGRSGPDGAYTFRPPVCGQELGVRVTPPAGYAVLEGRGSSFFDGLSPRPGAPAVVRFTLLRS